MEQFSDAPYYDVVVVGGGPGGSTTATFVAMQGHRVLLLEKEKMPVYKIGESLLPATVHGICPMLGVSQALQDAKFVRKLGGTFLWGRDTEPWTFSFNASSKMPSHTSTAYQVERMKFDMILLENAEKKGVRVCQQHKATELIIQGERVAGLRYTDARGTSRSCRARYVVDASGHETTLSRHVGTRVYSQFFQNLALFGYYKRGKRLPQPKEGNIFCASFKDGWFWYIPLSPSLTSVGAVVGKEQAFRIAGGYEQAMNEFIRACPPVQDLLSSASRVTDGQYGKLRVRKDYSYCHSNFWKPGIILVGDAACFIDPVFSSGVHLATYSALLAARSINTELKGKVSEDRCFTEFEQRYRREFGMFYDFLLAFYDQERDLDSYFWHARKILNSKERGNEAFINLVAGIGGSGERLYNCPEEAFVGRAGLGDSLFSKRGEDVYFGAEEGDQREGSRFYQKLLSEVVQMQSQARLGADRVAETPLFSGGLIPSADGLHWAESAVGEWATS